MPGRELSESVARGASPYTMGERAAPYTTPAIQAIQGLLRYLGAMQQQAPAPNAPLPRMDPRTGQIAYPGGAQGPQLPQAQAPMSTGIMGAPQAQAQSAQPNSGSLYDLFSGLFSR